MLKIVKVLEQKRYTNTRAMTNTLAECLHCGKVSEILEQNVAKHNRLNRKHCGHCITETFHYLTNTRIWRVWHGMKYRTKDMTDKNYAGRGIGLCPEWEKFENFYRDMCEGYSRHLTIERIDVNGPYSKANCRWATNMEQQSNKRTNRNLEYEGEVIHLAELCRRSGVSKMMLTMRLSRGMSAEQAVRDARSSRYGKSQRPVDIRRRQKRMSTT